VGRRSVVDLAQVVVEDASLEDRVEELAVEELIAEPVQPGSN
jgi:hypothetical protein